MHDAWTVTCPYCFESIEIIVETEDAGHLVQDCEVCCNPWALFIERDEWGGLVDVVASRAQ